MPENPNLDYYYILRETGNTEPILIEYGFIDNKNDSFKLKNNLEAYAEAVVKALTEYLDYPYTPNEEVKNSYIVKKGDTLYSISKRFNIPVEEIKRINNLTSNNLSIGQELTFVESQMSEEQEIYIVQRGDTLYSISQKYNVSISDIKRLNNLNNNILSINQQLIIPKKTTVEEETEIILPSEQEEYSTYIVQKGDSIWKISQKYNITPDELININNLTDLTLQINQELLVPKEDVIEIPTNKYIVEKGDTLWSIAKKNNLTVDELKKLNNLDSNLLSVGQLITIK